VNANSKLIALMLVAIVVAAGVAYTVGVKKGEQEATKPTLACNLPANHPATNVAPQHPSTNISSTSLGNPPPSGHAGASRFVHFRVGNSNVKGMFANDKEVWVGTSGGAIRYNLAKQDYKVYDVKNKSLLSNGVFHLSQHDDQIMVGTYGGGLSVFDLKKETWTNYNIPQGLADQFVYDMDVDHDGNYWVATWSGANFIPHGDMKDNKDWQTFTVKNTKGGLPNDWVYGVEIGKNGEIWFATEGGLARYGKDKKWTNWQHKDGLGADYDVVKNDISFANDPARASQHHAQQKTEQGIGKDIKVGYNPNYIVSMVVDDKGVVWCGTWGGGLSKFDGNKFTTYSVKDGLPGNHVFMLKKAHDGNVWIGTNKGLAKQQADGSFRVMTTADGLFADNVFSMAEAPDGSLWVGSFGGVAKITNPKI